MGRTILIVEDYDDTRIFMKFLIESYGYEVIEATNGAEAIEMLRSNSTDLVLMDISMPVMDGIAATKAIRKFKSGDKLPIIALTAFGKRYEEKALAAGCDQLLEKPVDFNALEGTLHQYLP